MHVRSFWKSGFYGEMVGDAKKALKHYTRGLEALLREPVPPDAAKLMEIKVVAEFFVLRLSRVSMMRGDLIGACERLQKVMGELKGRVGPEALAFQHWGWCAHVHEAFARLLQAYGRTELPLPAGPENPGFHFQAAARYTSLRRASAQQRKKAMTVALPVVDTVPDTPSRLEPSRQKYAGQPYEEFHQVCVAAVAAALL